jgi:hypothetical protein
MHITGAAILAASVSYVLAVGGGRWIFNRFCATWARIFSLFTRININKAYETSGGMTKLFGTPKRRNKDSKLRHRDSTMYTYVGQVSRRLDPNGINSHRACIYSVSVRLCCALHAYCVTIHIFALPLRLCACVHATLLSRSVHTNCIMPPPYMNLVFFVCLFNHVCGYCVRACPYLACK